jgi:hypothetical protein
VSAFFSICKKALATQNKNTRDEVKQESLAQKNHLYYQIVNRLPQLPRFLACSLLQSIAVEKVWLSFGEFLGRCNQGRAYESKQEVANIEKSH